MLSVYKTNCLCSILFWDKFLDLYTSIYGTWDTGEDNDLCFLVVGDSSYVGNTASLQYGVYRNSSISPNHLIIRTPIIICDNNFWIKSNKSNIIVLATFFFCKSAIPGSWIIIVTRQTFLSLFFDYLRAIQWAIICENVIDRTTYHLAQVFHTEINEDSRLINAGVHALTRQTFQWSHWSRDVNN